MYSTLMVPEFDGLVAWTFEVEEVSCGVYRVRGTRQDAGPIELTGEHYDDLLQRARDAAEKIERDLLETRSVIVSHTTNLTSEAKTAAATEARNRLSSPQKPSSY